VRWGSPGRALQDLVDSENEIAVGPRNEPTRRFARAKEGRDRYDKALQMFSNLRVAMATDIAIVKTLAETNTSSIAGPKAASRLRSSNKRAV
jgi:hypothetical protein